MWAGSVTGRSDRAGVSGLHCFRLFKPPRPSEEPSDGTQAFLALFPQNFGQLCVRLANAWAVGSRYADSTEPAPCSRCAVASPAVAILNARHARCLAARRHRYRSARRRGRRETLPTAATHRLNVHPRLDCHHSRLTCAWGSYSGSTQPRVFRLLDVDVPERDHPRTLFDEPCRGRCTLQASASRSSKYTRRRYSCGTISHCLLKRGRSGFYDVEGTGRRYFRDTERELISVSFLLETSAIFPPLFRQRP